MTIPPIARRPVAHVGATPAVPAVPPVCILLVATVALNLGALASFGPLRAVVELPLALLVPGYAVALAVFGRRAPLDGAPLLALALLLSMASYPLLALALSGLGAPLSTGSVLAGTDTVVLLLAIVAALRAPPTGPQAAAPRSAGILPASPCGQDARAPRDQRDACASRGRTLGLVLALGVLGVGAAGAAHVLPSSPDAPYTAFYLSGRWARRGTTAHATAVSGGRLAVAVSVANHTGRRQTYRLSPLLDDRHWRAYTLDVPAGGTWTGTVGGALPASGCLHRLSLTLHMRGRRDAQRPLVLWVQGSACAGTGATHGAGDRGRANGGTSR